MYEGGVLRPTRPLDLPEHGTFRAFILPALPKAGAETLADVLGIDLSDEAQLQALAESQHQAVMEIAGLGQNGLTDVVESPGLQGGSLHW